MKLSPEEQAHLRSSFHSMSIAKKIEHIFTYYKLPIVIILIAVSFIVSTAYSLITKKEALLYTAYINVSVSDTLNEDLSSGFVDFSGKNEKKYEVFTNSALYLSGNASTENAQYSYASQTRIVGAIAAKQLDVVFMNNEAYDILSEKGYLCDLESFFGQDKQFYEYIKPYLMTNSIVLEDNELDYNLHNADIYKAVTESSVNGLNVTNFPIFKQTGGFSGTVILGILAECPRSLNALDYAKYISAYES